MAHELSMGSFDAICGLAQGRPAPSSQVRGMSGRACQAGGTRRLRKSYPNYEIFYRGDLTPADRLLRCR
jgi:hypothetical protein